MAELELVVVLGLSIVAGWAVATKAMGKVDKRGS